jgi:predicted RNA binding protein YcfA (HicA-like mRNA interferase family)
MSDRIPVVSGKKLVSFMKSVGYSIVRQRGSHIRMEKITLAGTHKITIPNHNPIAKGTLNDIISKVALWNQISKEKLLESLRVYA